MMKSENSEMVIELKYCERCGELWFREAGSNACLCGPCVIQEPRVAERYQERKRPKSQTWLGPMTEVMEKLQGVAAENGRQL